MAQNFKDDDPFASDDYISSSEEEDEYENKIKKNLLIATKPYEETYQKFSVWYNEYFTKMVEFEDEKIHSHERINDTVLNINNMVNVENQGILDIVQTKNTDFDKIVQIFTYIDVEVQKSKELLEDKIFGALIMYGEKGDNLEDEEEEEIDGESENDIARILSILKEGYDEVKKLMAIVFNLINQLNELYNKKGLYYKQFKSIEIFSPLDTIGTVVSLMYTLDQIVANNECLLSDWNQYKKMINIIQQEPEKFQCTKKQLKILERTLVKYEKSILSGQCTDGFLKQQWEIPGQFVANNKSYTTIYKNENLQHLFLSYFKSKITFFKEVLASPSEYDEKQQYLNLLGAYAFYRKLYPKSEEKTIFKELWNLQRKAPIVITFSHTICYTYKFLKNICPLTKSATLDPKDPRQYIKEYTQYTDSKIIEYMKSLYSSFCTWIGKMESLSTSNQCFEDSLSRPKSQVNQQVSERVQNRTKLIMTGLLIAYQVKNQITTCLLLHLQEQTEIPPEVLFPIRQGIEILQAIKYVFNSQKEGFHPSFFQRSLHNQLEQLLKDRILNIRKLDQQSKKGEWQESRSSLELMLKLTRYPSNSTNNYIINFISQIFLQTKAFDLKQTVNIRFIIQKICIFSRLQYKIEEATNCDFLYQARDIIPILIQQIYQKPVLAKRMPFIFSAIQDTMPLFKSVSHLENKEDLLDRFKESMTEIFYTEFLDKTRKAVEDFLRLNIHTMLIQQIENKNPYKEQIQQINRLLNVGKIQIFDNIVDIRSEIQQHLNESFYNINVLNLHDMETYEEMRTLAEHQFQLKLMHVYIPSQTIDQGATKGQLDILEIIRNIPQFVQRYTYNLYSQTFIEITTDSKIITTVGINQISDSIKTHGIGILNTTINSLYKYILSKIKGFSQFLFDELILSQLKKEQKWFKKNSEELNGQYPFGKAQQFLKDIQRLGKFEDGSTYLDKFRTLVTHVGNALGFVRMIRSASLNYSSQSIEYLPSAINTDETFTEMAKGALFGDVTVQAAQELDSVFDYLVNSFSSKSDYLTIMVTAVQKKINVPENKHLKLFYQILPALSLNFVDSVIMAKERLSKANPYNAYFCDDGLVIGISYFLKLLDQNELFGSLHWKEEIKEYFEEQFKHIQKATDDLNNKKLSETKKRRMQEPDFQRGLSQRKIEGQITEFDMFFYAFNTCQVLFRDDTN